jgi:DNA-binding NarL/FixJ family response regulator
MKRARILIADDHEIFSAAFRKLLEPDFEVVGCVSDGRMLLKATQELKPDVVIADIGMPLLNGLDAGKEIKRLLPLTKLIFLTMNPDSELAQEAVRIGASAYLLKTSHPSELPKAIHDALAGISYITPSIRRSMDEAFIRDPTGTPRSRELTPRKREVLQMLAEGKSMKEIAFILDVKLRTVQFHKYRIMEELGIRTNAEIVQYAMRHGMISSIEPQTK